MIIGALGVLWFVLPVLSALIVNIGNVTGILVFGTLLLCALFKDRFFKWIGTMRSTPAGSTVLASILAVLLFVFSVAGYLSVEMIRAAQPREQDDRTLVLLGCGVYGERPSLMLVERMQAAYAYMTDHPDSVCVLSGGQGPGENISEAEAMFRWLSAKGISSDRLYKEDRSTSTRENLLYTEKMIRENHLSDKILIVSNEFHEYRAGKIADKLKLDHAPLAARTAWWLFPTYTVREMYAILYERFF